LYQDRAGISLYDAQWKDGEKVPIPEPIIQSVLQAMKRFKRTCYDFKVPDNHIKVLATEATRVAINASDYITKIKDATGWEVEMLPKEEEGKIGAFGVASSFDSVKGIVMDLGGGSAQITWLIAQNGEIKMNPSGSVSMPYGAAALSHRLDEAQAAGGDAEADLQREIKTKLKEAVQTINIRDDILLDAKGHDGLHLYLSGGGFRGWGFVLMSQHQVKPYPIPIINGFRASTEQFNNVQLVTQTAKDDNIFRVSDRRANQVPAVALLVSCLTEVLPAVKTVSFAQGGVREGALFTQLTDAQKAEHPVETATKKFATESAAGITDVLLSSIPPNLANYLSRMGITKPLVQALAQSMYIHNVLNKDIQAASGLRSTTTGVLGGMHGADHEGRALLAVILCERWGGAGALSPADADFHGRLLALISPEAAWWALYLGRIGALLGDVYPAGVVDPANPMIKLTASVSESSDGYAKRKLKVQVASDKETLTSEGFLKALLKLEKLGKKKSWPSGSEGCKVQIETKVEG
jgi:retrograde regulation protein 2